jgi:hypothetical protein
MPIYISNIFYKNIFTGLFFFFSISFANSQQIGVSDISPKIPNNYIPAYAIEEADRFKKEFLSDNSQEASDLRYSFFYEQSGNACLEYTVVPKDGYIWNPLKWVGFTWGNGWGVIGNNAIRYTQTRKTVDEAQYRIEERRKDNAFNEIEKIVLRIATEYDYDYQSAYGIRVKYRKPNIKKGVCDSYADAVVTALRNHPYVSSVEKWSSKIGNHAWNVIILKDGRKLYCDATWYDGNNIDDDGYVIDIPVQSPVNLTFDIVEFNSLGGATNDSTGKIIAVHFAWSDARKLK